MRTMTEPSRAAVMRAARENQLASVRRVRLLRRLAPVAALAATGLIYGLHHTTPLEGHSVGVVLVVVAAAGVGVAIVFAALAASADRQLPVVVTLRPRSAHLRGAEAGDLDFCAALQRETLPHGFFAELGHSFLRAYLGTFVSSPHAVALLLTVDDAPVGMVVGVLRPRAHRQWVLRHRGFRLATIGAAALATRPRLGLRFLHTRVARYARAWRGRRSPAPGSTAAQPAVLSHVAVAPGAEGAGFGRRLVDAFVGAAGAAGASSVVLATLADEAGAAGFYRKLGWHEDRTILDFDGQPMTIFSLSLSPER